MPRNLRKCLRAGDLTAVYVPEGETEALRDLERARTAAKAAEKAAKHQLGKFLLRHGRRWDGGSNSMLRHLDWIRKQKFEPGCIMSGMNFIVGSFNGQSLSDSCNKFIGSFGEPQAR